MADEKPIQVQLVQQETPEWLKWMWIICIGIIILSLISINIMLLS